MNRIFTSFIIAALLLTSGSVKAQFTVELTDVPRTNWCEGTDVVFKLSEIATQMNCTAGQIVDALDEWSAAANGNTNGYALSSLFWLENSSVTPTYHSEQYGGYMMDQNGNFDSWNAGAVWGIYIHSWDIEKDELALTIDQNPTKPLAKGQVCHGMVSLNLLGGKATFAITFQVDSGDGIDKDPVTDISKLTVVGENSISMEQEPNTEWLNYSYTIDTKGIAELLDIDANYMESMFKYMVFAKNYDFSNETWGALTNTGAATPSPGFYFSGGIIPEGEENESAECRNASYGDNNLFWIANLQYSLESEQVSCYMGQYPNGMTVGSTRKADIYIVYGDKAYIIHYTLTVGVPNQTFITDLTKVGDLTWTITDRDPRKSWTELENLKLDINAINTAFSEKAGKTITADDIVFKAINSYNGITADYTADNNDSIKGFWLSSGGIVNSYSSSSACYYINYLKSDSSLALGNKPSYFNGGENLTNSVYLVVGDSMYYEIKLNMNIMKPQYTIQTCKVTDYALNVQLVPSADTWEIGSTSMAKVEKLLGTANGILYGVTSTGDLTTAYSVTEATSTGGGGFWMSAEDENHMAYAASYSGTGAYAMWYYNNKITWFAVPGLRNVGETSYGTFYIADLWNGVAVKLNTTIKFVDKIVEINPVAEEDVAVAPRNATGDDFEEVSLNLNKCCEQLVCTESELLENGTWMVMGQDGYLTSANFDGMYGFSFNENGEAIANIDEAVFNLGFVDGTIHSFVVDDANVNKVYRTTLYVMYNNKLYAFNMIVAKDPSAIESVEVTKAKSGKIYDISGRVVTKHSKGIYIQDGKKYFQK